MTVTLNNPAPAISVSYTLNGVTQTVSQSLYVEPWLARLTISPTSVAGGVSSTATVTLNAAAPSGGIAVSVNEGSYPMPGMAAFDPNTHNPTATITVPQGQTSASAAIYTWSVSSSTTVTFQATYNSATKTASLTVLPLAVHGVSLSPATVAGSNTSTGTVTLTTAGFGTVERLRAVTR